MGRKRRRRETRARLADDYTGASTRIFESIAQFGIRVRPERTGAVLACATQWSSVMARMAFEPEVPSIRPHLVHLGASLVTRGQWAALIAVGDGGVTLTPVASITAAERQPGHVKVEVAGQTRVVSRDAVLWFQSPVPPAGGDTGLALAALIEASRLESSKPTGVVVGMDSSRVDGASAAAGLQAAWGDTLQTGGGGSALGGKGFSGVSDGKATTAHLGSEPTLPQSQALMHDALSRSVAACYGVHASLLVTSSGGEGGLREGGRVTESTVAPLLAALVQTELRARVEPEVEVTVLRRSASDWASIGRAIKSLVDAGMPIEMAAETVQLSGMADA